MLTFNGYIPKRRGIMEHLRDGRLTLMDYIVFDLLLIWADHRTGIATTNGPGLVFLSGNQLKLDTVQTSLRRLEEGGYIRRPFYVQGQRGDQKIFIDKYVVTRKTERGTEVRTLSFAKTTDWNNPVYEDIAEDPAESHTEHPSVDQPVDQPSNENRKPIPGNRETKTDSVERRGQVEKDQVQPQKQDLPLRGGRLSESNTNPKGNGNSKPRVLSGRELQAALGGVEVPDPVNPKQASPVPPTPSRNLTFDKMVLRDRWRKMLRDGEIELPRSSSDMYGGNDTDLGLILDDRPEETIDHILAVLTWAVETSDYWFKVPKGYIPDYNALRNAYGAMATSFDNYQKKAGAAV